MNETNDKSLKEEFKELVERIKFLKKTPNKRFTNEDVAKVLDYEPPYFNSLMGKTGKVLPLHIALLQEKFSDVLKNDDVTKGNIRPVEQSYLEKRRAQKNEQQPFMVPLVPIKAQAGYVKSFDQVNFIDNLGKFPLPPDVAHVGNSWRYWEVEGDSMEKDLFEGDYVLTSQIHPEDWHHLQDFYTYVIVNHENVWIKRVVKEPDNKLILISTNEKKYGPRLISLEDVNEIWVFRRRITKSLPVAKMFDMEEIRKRLEDENKNQE